MCSTEGSLAKMQSTDRGLARKKGILTSLSGACTKKMESTEDSIKTNPMLPGVKVRKALLCSGARGVGHASARAYWSAVP